MTSDVKGGDSGVRRGVHRSAAVLVVALLATAWAVSPRLRDEVRVSFTRLPATYTEVFFAVAPHRTGDGRAVLVPVTVVHHGTTAETVAVRAAVTVGGATRAVDGTFEAVPGRPVDHSFTVAAPAGDSLVEVTLPGRAPALHYRLGHEEAA